VNAESSENKPVIIDTGLNSGRYNMDYDMALVEKCRLDSVSFLRFYAWKPYCISLGYNQKKFFPHETIDTARCNEAGIDIVTRPTGGRAVLHAEEITYSVVLHSSEPVQLLHNRISQAIINGLVTIEPANDNFSKLSLEKQNPDLLHLARTGMYNLCFNTSVKYEINYMGRKLVGSAQRKFGNVTLQHGSILIGNYHERIVDFLKLDDESKRENIKQTLRQKTVCLNEILNHPVSYEEVKSALLKGFEKFFEHHNYSSVV
jgi:lipoate-protein ligase A